MKAVWGPELVGPTDSIDGSDLSAIEMRSGFIELTQSRLEGASSIPSITSNDVKGDSIISSLGISLDVATEYGAFAALKLSYDGGGAKNGMSCSRESTRLMDFLTGVHINRSVIWVASCRSFNRLCCAQNTFLNPTKHNCQCSICFLCICRPSATLLKNLMGCF